MHYKEKAVLSSKNGLRIYEGCTNGCIYCDSRSSYYKMKHEFHDVEVIPNAPEKLEGILRRKRKSCMIGTSPMSDPYIHLESRLGYTRKSLEVINKYGFGVTLLTKSANVINDIDILGEINQKSKCIVQMTMTTFDDELCKKIEPNVSVTSQRFEALMKLRENGIETVVWLVPILPFINDTEENIKGLLHMCVEANVYGIVCFGMGLTLREGSREYFYKQLDKKFPGIKQKYIKKYQYVYDLRSDNHDRLMQIFYEECRNNNIVCDNKKIFQHLFTYESKECYEQLDLFHL